MERIFVTGAGGYIGSKLIGKLLELNYEVTACDRFFFGIESLNNFQNNKFLKILKKDIRDLDTEDLKSQDIVLDLASLSNDPSGDLDPDLTFEINGRGRIHVAKTAKDAGVQKYILSSSCSVYGKGENNDLNEKSSTHPQSIYAQSTLLAEDETMLLSDDNFSVTALRNSTVFGLSQRMRFDLVVNLMTLAAFQKQKIIVMGGGLQWRPLVHINDVVRGFISAINSPVEVVNKQIFNIGLDNFQVKNIAYLIRETLPFRVDIEFAPDDVDSRNYNVNFKKAKTSLGFTAEISVEKGIIEIYNALKSGSVDTGLKTITVKWYQHLIESRKLMNEIIVNDRLL